MGKASDPDELSEPVQGHPDWCDCVYCEGILPGGLVPAGRA